MADGDVLDLLDQMQVLYRDYAPSAVVAMRKAADEIRQLRAELAKVTLLFKELSGGEIGYLKAMRELERILDSPASDAELDQMRWETP